MGRGGASVPGSLIAVTSLACLYTQEHFVCTGKTAVQHHPAGAIACHPRREPQGPVVPPAQEAAPSELATGETGSVVVWPTAYPLICWWRLIVLLHSCTAQRSTAAPWRAYIAGTRELKSLLSL